MRLRKGVAIGAIVILFAFFVPLIPFSEYPASQVHGMSSVGPPDVTGSIAYFFFGYGGVIMPSHSYVVITHSDMAQYQLAVS